MPTNMRFPFPLMSTAAQVHRHLTVQSSVKLMPYLPKRRYVSWWLPIQSPAPAAV